MFEIKEWDTVVSWSFGTGNHTNMPCMICRRMLNETSTQYEENPCDERADGKVIATGECGHCFHLDCINIWRTRDGVGTCPSCQAHWQTAHTAPIAE